MMRTMTVRLADGATRVPVVQRPRTPPFHGDDTGSNPVGDANQLLLRSLSSLQIGLSKVDSYRIKSSAVWTIRPRAIGDSRTRLLIGQVMQSVTLSVSWLS